MRGDLKKKFEDEKLDMKNCGVAGLPDDGDRAAADELLDTLKEYGIFVTRRGELEHWLPELKIPGKKTEWTMAMLERMGSDPSNPTYVRPFSGDVWAFMRAIVAWVQNPARKGTK